MAFDMPPRETLDCLEATRDGFTLARFRECLGGGVPVGAVRASLGMASSEGDVERMVDVLQAVVDRS